MDHRVEQLLSQTEQQLSVTKEFMLEAAREALGEDALLTDCYGWAVDLMLRHNLTLQTTSTAKVLLPKDVRQSMDMFIQSLCSQVSRDSPADGGKQSEVMRRRTDLFVICAQV